MDLNHHAFLPSIHISDFGDTIPWPTDFQEDLALDTVLSRSHCKLGFLGISSSTSGQICLMFLSLSVCEIGTFIGVKSQTETAFERAEVVPENVWVLWEE